MKRSNFINMILCTRADLRRVRIEGTSTEQKKGFTLIELSIVLVIIGLIVAGVLTGQDLILAAKIRATTSQYMSFNTAANAFTNKYNALPGDLAASTAETFGFGYVNGGGPGQGDGDGYIGAASAASMATAEGVLFWSDLYQSNLIPNALTMVTPGVAWAPADIVTTPSLAVAFPISKLGGGNYFFAGTFTDGFNYYGISGLADYYALTTGSQITAGGNLSPVMAYDIDVKIDDGVPNTGIVQSIGVSTSQTVSSFAEGGSLMTATGAAVACLNATGTAYSGGTAASSKTPSCQIRLRFN